LIKARIRIRPKRSGSDRIQIRNTVRKITNSPRVGGGLTRILGWVAAQLLDKAGDDEQDLLDVQQVLGLERVKNIPILVVLSTVSSPYIKCLCCHMVCFRDFKIKHG
jgi:hypothetical protein